MSFDESSDGDRTRFLRGKLQVIVAQTGQFSQQANNALRQPPVSGLRLSLEGEFSGEGVTSKRQLDSLLLNDDILPVNLSCITTRSTCRENISLTRGS
jgi:hypothetical protein